MEKIVTVDLERLGKLEWGDASAEPLWCSVNQEDVHGFGDMVLYRDARGLWLVAMEQVDGEES